MSEGTAAAVQANAAAAEAHQRSQMQLKGENQEPEDNEKDINDQLTMESMFRIYDKDMGTFMDVREIMDFTDDDFKDNEQILSILKQMNQTNPVPPPINYTNDSQGNISSTPG